MHPPVTIEGQRRRNEIHRPRSALASSGPRTDVTRGTYAADSWVAVLLVRTNKARNKELQLDHASSCTTGYWLILCSYAHAPFTQNLLLVLRNSLLEVGYDLGASLTLNPGSTQSFARSAVRMPECEPLVQTDYKKVSLLKNKLLPHRHLARTNLII